MSGKRKGITRERSKEVKRYIIILNCRDHSEIKGQKLYTVTTRRKCQTKE